MRIALIGNPNAGKTTLFNQLTGTNQTVGNYPGVTVDIKIGNFKLGANEHEVIDLPGIYSLYPNSEEEFVSVRFLLQNNSKNTTDIILYVADATNIERNLLLFTQLSDLKLPIVLCLAKVDEAKKSYDWNTNEIGQDLGVPVIENDENFEYNLSQIIEVQSYMPGKSISTYQPDKEILKTLLETENQSDFRLMLYAHHLNILEKDEEKRQKVSKALEEAGFKTYSEQAKEILSRYEYIELFSSKFFKSKVNRDPKTSKIDQLLMHPLWGTLAFIFILFVIFQTVFTIAAYPSDWIDGGMSLLISTTSAFLPSSVFSSLITDGILAGIGAVIVFIPQIFLLFFLISLLEKSGYMARAVFLSDTFMRKFGMNGRSLVSLVSGTACSVPAIMATRTIPNYKERLITILTTPFISCSARLPIYTLLVALVAPKKQVWGFINYEGLLMLGLYVGGAILALIVGWLLKISFGKKSLTSLILELPSYEKPHIFETISSAFSKSKDFFIGAGKIIFVASLVIWVLTYSGPRGFNLNVDNEEVIQHSFIGHIGKGVQPVLAPLGYDWKMSVAIITSFSAREVFVSTVSILYPNNHPDQINFVDHIDSLKDENGQKLFDLPTSASLLIFYMIALQCMSTLAIIKKETGGWSWAIYLFIGMTALAYFCSYVTYSILS